MLITGRTDETAGKELKGSGLGSPIVDLSAQAIGAGSGKIISVETARKAIEDLQRRGASVDTGLVTTGNNLVSETVQKHPYLTLGAIGVGLWLILK